MTIPDYKSVAAQLRQPSGADGLKTAERMSENNGPMIRRCIDHLAPDKEENILEIGPGGGLHIPNLLEKAEGIRYTGVDISETMIELAKEHNKEGLNSGNVVLDQVLVKNGYTSLPFASDHFDKIFTVNTVYFWDNALAQANEIFRVLKPSGTFILCFASEQFMAALPFTQYGFELYSIEKASALLLQADFSIDKVTTEKEMVKSIAGEEFEREIIFIKAIKS